MELMISWHREGRKEGVIQGIMQGIVQGNEGLVERQLRRHLISVPADVSARLEFSCPADLEQWLGRHGAAR